MTLADSGRLGPPAGQQLLSRVVAHGLEQLEALGSIAWLADHDERLTHKPAQQIKDVLIGHVVARTHRFSGFESPGTGENG